MTRLRFLALATLSPAWLLAADYTFTPLPETQQGQVEIALAEGKRSTEFRMPAWAPGDYQLFDYGKKIVAIRFFRGDNEVPFERGEDPNHWKVSGGADRVRYIVGESRGNFSENLRVTESEFFISGPGVFGWFVGHQSEKQTLQLADLPEGFVTATPLRAVPGKTAEFTAESYDELLDSPIVSGRHTRSQRFMVGDVPHDVVFFGRSTTAALGPFADLGDKLARANIGLFGRLPYPRYLYLYDFGGFPAGLEHATSARMGAYSTDPRAMASLISHEFFHAYNVKVIRPRVLGPFDYTKPAVTGSLWWLEGVTDYYATVMLVRAGLETRESALRGMGRDYVRLARNANRLRVSAEESSRRVWENRGSQGFGGLSYYEKGRLIGFVLDVAIRAETGGRASLDQVMRSLFDECRDGKPGFAEGRIRELCVEVGGAALGPIYDQCVTSTQELPLANFVGRLGWAWTGTQLQDDPLARNAIGQAWPNAVGSK